MRIARRTVHRLAAAGLLLAVAVPLTLARAGGIEVEGAWARAAMKGRNGAVFLTIRNTGTEDDALVAARGDVAGTIELHTHVMEEGVMKMRPIERIPVPAGATVELKPGGYHVMLIGLERELREGDRVPLELAFEKAGTMRIEAEVRAAGALGHGMGDGMHRGMSPGHGAGRY